jgi:peptidoglycan/xylan/chitin deacetylase (PgdA/CDA1 family)
MDPMHEVMLTFDDGPGPSTGVLLEVLRRHKAIATFYVLGRHVEGREAVLLEALRDGHRLGNHTYSHIGPTLTPDVDGLSREIENVDAALQRLQREVGVAAPIPIRLPYGRRGDHDWRVRVVRAAGREPVGWDLIPGDWALRSEEEGARLGERLVLQVQGRLRQGHPRTTVLLHDGDAEDREASRVPTVRAVDRFLALAQGCRWAHL